MCDNDRYFHFHLLKESQVAFSPYYRVAFFKKRKEIKFYLLYYCSRLLLQMDAITINNFQVVYTQLHSFMFLQRSTFVLLFFTTTTAKKCSFEFSKTTYQGGEKMQSNNVASVSSFFDMIYPLNIIVSNIIMYLFEVYGKDHLFCCNNDQPKTIFAFISILKSGANQHWYIFCCF